MTLEDLKNNHGNLFDEIQNKAKGEALEKERDRVMNILNLNRPGAEEIINTAIENGETAGEVAIKILNDSSINTINKAKEVQDELERESDEIKNLNTDPEDNPETNKDKMVNAAIEKANKLI